MKKIKFAAKSFPTVWFPSFLQKAIARSLVEYDQEIYKRRNEVERYFRRLKGFRRVFTRYDKLDVMYSSFVIFAMICETLRE